VGNTPFWGINTHGEPLRTMKWGGIVAREDAPAGIQLRGEDDVLSSASVSSELAIDVLERQQRQMAFGLHDGPVQTLSAAGAMLARAGGSDHVETMRAQVAAAEGLLDCAVSEMRDIMQELSPSALAEASLTEKLQEYAKRYESLAGIPVRVDVVGAEEPLESHIQVSVFRVVQEALANVRKHANARSVTIEVEFTPDAVCCTVRDDGAGFDPDRAAALGKTSHWGIAGMRERMTLVDGHLTIASSPGEGTAVHVSVPVASA
jgi:two-component system sensor histidine kinase DegS